MTLKLNFKLPQFECNKQCLRGSQRTIPFVGRLILSADHLTRAVFSETADLLLYYTRSDRSNSCWHIISCPAGTNYMLIAQAPNKQQQCSAGGLSHECRIDYFLAFNM